MKTKLIEIQVHGFTGDGKTNVCAVIRDALIAAYGPHTQVASRELSLERDSKNDNKPTKDAVFVICEVNHGAMCTYKPEQSVQVVGDVVDYDDDIKKRMRFYAVNDLISLSRIQSEHIARLQKKLPTMRDEQPRNPRSGGE